VFIRHSLKNMLRSWPKSLLFFVLLGALCVLLCIGVSLTAAVLGFLRECDQTYTTVAVFEYMGANYPDETTLDPGIAQTDASFAFSSIAKNPAVLNWDPCAIALGSIAGKTANAAVPPYKNDVVYLIQAGAYSEQEACYKFTLEKDLLDPGAKAVSGYLNTNGAPVEQGHFYLLHGLRVMGNTSYNYVQVTPFVNATAAAAGVDGSVGNMIVDVTGPDGKASIPADSVFYQIADTLNAVNRGVTVYATNDLDAFLPFQQADLSVASGRSFTPEEYADGAKVCLLPERLANLIGAKIGDQIDLSVVVQAGASQRESYWAGTGYTYEHSYTVVGIFSQNDLYRDSVFIPKSNTVDLSPNQYSYTLGQAKLKNAEAEQFYTDMQQRLPSRVRVTVYDQGYAAAAAPLRDVLRVALIVTAVCALTTLAMLALFGFLFVYRQRELSRTMRRLGVTNGGIFSYFLVGSGCIALLASAVGAFVSQKLSGAFIELVQKTIANYTADNLLYSNANLTISKTLAFAPKIEFSVFLLTALAVFVCAVISCLGFTALSLRSHRQRRKIGSRKAETRSRALNGGALKYAWLSVRRGASRSALPVILCALSAALLLQLTSTTVSYEKSYNQLTENTDISGYFTDNKGRWRTGLLLGGDVVHDFVNNALLSQVTITKTMHYVYNYDFPDTWTSFSYETFMNMVGTGPGFIYTNDLASVQEFYGLSQLPVTFLDGYGLSTFSQVDPAAEPTWVAMDDTTGAVIDPNQAPDIAVDPAIVSTAFLAENNLALGDTADLVRGDSDYVYDETIKIVGSYVKQGQADNIYLPLANYYVKDFRAAHGELYPHGYYYIPGSYIFNPNSDVGILKGTTYDSLSFTTQGAANLNAFKDYLASQGYSEVNKIRTIRSFIVIEDKTFLATQSAMSQRLWYMQNIFPVLYALLILLSALIPFILIQMRKRESAIMRAQGASGGRAFLSVFLEQLLLSLPGVLIGAGIWLLIFRTGTSLGLTLALLFALSWLVGAAFSAFLLNRSSVRKILKAEE